MIERDLFAKLLWSMVDDLGVRKHNDYVLYVCNQRAYLLAHLKRQGLPFAQLQKVFDAVTLARTLYEVPDQEKLFKSGGE